MLKPEVDSGRINNRMSVKDMVAAADISALFLLGFLGTGHCIGMCGPLVFAFPAKSGKLAGHLYYHGGRLLTYMLLGAVVALAGLGLAHAGGAAMVARFQIVVSLLAAGFLMVLAGVRFGLVAEPKWMARIDPSALPGVKRLTAAGGSKEGHLLLVGLAMGLLPCGLSYSALARAMAAHSPLQGAMLLGIFGLGTLPGLLAVGLGGAGLFARHRTASELLAGMLMVAMALRLTVSALWPG